jgi:hypothetical protein
MGTAATESGLAELKRALPGLKIVKQPTVTDERYVGRHSWHLSAWVQLGNEPIRQTLAEVNPNQLSTMGRD